MGRCGEHRTGGANPPGPRALQPYPQRAEHAAQQMLNDYAALKPDTARNRNNAFFCNLAASRCSLPGKVRSRTVCLRSVEVKISLPKAGSPPQVSREQVLARQPQAIVVVGNASEIPKIEQFWHRQLKIPVIALNSDWFERASPRIILAAKQLCAELAESHSNR